MQVPTALEKKAKPAKDYIFWTHLNYKAILSEL